MNLKKFHGITGDLELSFMLPHDDFTINLFYEEYGQQNWSINNVKWSDDLLKNAKKQAEREKRGLKKLLKKQGNISLGEIEDIFNLKLNFVKYDNMQKKELLELMNEFSKEDRDNFIIEALENYWNYEDVLNQYEKDIKENLRGVDVLVSFDKYKKKNNSILMSTITDSGTKIESEIVYPANNQNNKSTIEVSGITGDTIFTIFLQGYCYNSNDKTESNQSDGIESKLTKLKSLFDQDLITQDEYDAKRKEILDAM